MADTEETKPIENTEEPLDFGKKKKKKKGKDLEAKLKENEIEPSTTTSSETAQTKIPDEKLQNLTLNDKTEAAPTADDATEELDFTNLKKKSKKVAFTPVSDTPEDQDLARKRDENAIMETDSHGDWQGTERDYAYTELLQRVFKIMKEKNPDMITGEKKKFIMRPPQVARVGTKKTSFSNFADICRLLRRQEKHLLSFLLAELGTSGSLDSNNQLTIKGRFSQKQIENVLRRYIKEYITCHTCRSPETNLVKEERIFFLQCDTCGSRCAVASIKSGFQAQVVKRAAQRAKAT